ncbi:site-specific DNA-methyltransferase [Cyanobacterium aponinum UTEX 3222]|uniref:site-specific DNA-methyltransferase n=1 Tax=Cyanobacterium aponinum TaxID=379064 RepID=UPI002B4BAF0B|nr:site-specific DNA-methyltransferase [Cyanobacterium aponinum]WRL39129.1 site-specific DNA-methyltransferase [Cyanobacterium aponinum UTEX 3221]WRL40564.1 site-specific DNA-methyltransferase [Cyanobacterium aponinum UTEX 3222]
MATGITKNQWQEETTIISDEIFRGDLSYQITYEGKTPEEEIIAQPVQQIYTSIFGKENDNKLFFGDNLDILKLLIFQKKYKQKIKLIYIDPPYATNSYFHCRNHKSSYKDDLIGSHFLEFMRKRLILLRELLSDDGSIYVHLDNNMMCEIKVIMDEIFGAKNFRGLITRKKCSNKNYTKNSYGNISDYIIYYAKTEKTIWHRATIAWTEEKIIKEYPCIDAKTGKRYKKVPIHAPGIRNGETGKQWRGMMPPQGKHWQYTPEKLDELDKNGEIYWSSNGNPRRKVFFDENKGIPVQDIWLDVQDSLNQNIKITGYPTEKNHLLLERIIKASSNEGDYILDCFAGSGTTLDMTQKLGRKWIGIDNSSEAINHILKRFTYGLEEMGNFSKNNSVNNQEQLTIFTQEDVLKLHSSSNINFEFLTDERFYDLAINFKNKYKII